MFAVLRRSMSSSASLSRNFTSLTPTELANLLKEKQPVVVIDLRQADEKIGVAPIPGAVSFPVRKIIQDQIEADRKALQLLRGATKKTKKKKAANQAQQQQKLKELQESAKSELQREDFFGKAIALDADRFAARLGFKKPSESDQLVFVSSGTTRAIEIANAAEKYGFKNVSVLTGGARAWVRTVNELNYLNV